MKTVRDLTVTVLALGTTFGLGVITGISASAYIGLKVCMEIRKDYSNGFRKDQDE